MAGHSKWSKIKRSKGALDAKRGKIFTKCIHEITIAVKEGGGGDPDANPRLRLAIDKARGVNMPNDNIDRAIKRASGEGGGEQAQELFYEGYGPNGTAFLVQVMTDNKNRTVSEVRHAFTKSGGNLGESGCVAYMFEKKATYLIEKSLKSEDEIMEIILEAGADDVEGDDEYWEVTAEPNKFIEVKDAIEKEVKIAEAELAMVANTPIEIEGEAAEKAFKLFEMLEDLDDVVNVFSNADFNVEAD